MASMSLGWLEIWTVAHLGGCKNHGPFRSACGLLTSTGGSSREAGNPKRHGIQAFENGIFAGSVLFTPPRIWGRGWFASLVERMPVLVQGSGFSFCGSVVRTFSKLSRGTLLRIKAEAAERPLMDICPLDSVLNVMALKAGLL